MKTRLLAILALTLLAPSAFASLGGCFSENYGASDCQKDGVKMQSDIEQDLSDECDSYGYWVCFTRGSSCIQDDQYQAHGEVTVCGIGIVSSDNN